MQEVGDVNDEGMLEGLVSLLAKYDAPRFLQAP
jgi:hypothetical protein